MSETPRTDAASVSAEYIRREMTTPTNLEQAARELLAEIDVYCGPAPVWKVEQDALRAALASTERVSVPSDIVLGLTAVSTQPRYAGWVFVKHVDGEHWTTAAKLSPETWAMIAPMLAAAGDADGR